jgi:LuxR family transcriptional regulator, quorum-sensing system regulator BjaR1
MGMPYPGVLDFIDRINAIEKTDTIWQTFQKFTGKFGYTFGGVADVGRSNDNQGSRFLEVTWPREWHMRYREKKYIETDPAVLYLKQSREPFTWDEAMNSGLYGDPQQLVMNEVAQFGMAHGFVVPIVGLPTGVAVVTVAGTEVTGDRRDHAEIHLAALYAHARIRSLDNERRQRGNVIPLSSRERECLEWVAVGKSDWEIGEILNISEKTVNAHIERAKRKFEVPSRVQAVVVAMRMGAIQI